MKRLPVSSGYPANLVLRGITRHGPECACRYCHDDEPKRAEANVTTTAALDTLRKAGLL